MESSKMVSWKGWESYIFQVETITSGSLNSIRRMGEGFINGQANNQISMKESSSKEKEMEEAHFGGLMVVGMKDNLEMASKVDMACYIGMEAMWSMKAPGTTACLTEKVRNSLKMGRNTKGHLRKINSMGMEFSIKMMPSSMECGRIMSFR